MRSRWMAVAAALLAAHGCISRAPQPRGSATAGAAVGPWVQTSGGLAFRGRVHVADDAPRTVWVSVDVVNPTARSIRWEHGVCPPRLRAYAAPERAGPPVWESPPEACPLEAVLRTLAAGAQLDEFKRRPVTVTASVLGPSAAARRLYFTIVSPLHDFPELPSGDLLLAPGG